MKILITGIGGPAGICFARSLSEISEIELFGADANDSHIGRKFVKNFYLIPLADDPKFIDILKNIIKEENVDILIPLVDEELTVISKSLKDLDCRVFISPAQTISLTTDKGKLYEALSSVLPERHKKNNTADQNRFPLFAKPRIGRGSRDIHIINEAGELAQYDEDEYVIQELLGAPEVSVDSLFGFDGEMIVAVPRIRLEVLEGISTKGKIIKDDEILDKVKSISKILKFVGVINFQFMKSKDGFKLIEINARSSGGMGITVNSGIDIPKLAHDLFKHGHITDIPALKEGSFKNFTEILERQIAKTSDKIQ